MARNKRFFRIGLAILVLAVAMIACDDGGDPRIDTGDETISETVEDVRDANTAIKDVLMALCTATPGPAPTPAPTPVLTPTG